MLKKTDLVYVFSTVFILVCLVSLSWMGHEKSAAYKETTLSVYKKESHEKSLKQLENVQRLFYRIYRNLSTISELPSIIGANFDKPESVTHDAKMVVQSFYNSLYKDVQVSEIYITPVDFDPTKKDSITEELQEPFLMFDHNILGTNILPSHIKSTDEVEKYEYRLLREQLDWFKENKSEAKFLEEDVPLFIVGKEVITCDNRFFNRSFNDADRKGLIFSVPFYGQDGKLKGIVSAIILTKILKKVLFDGNYALINKKNGFKLLGRTDGQAFLSEDYIDKAQLDTSLVYSEILPIKINGKKTDWLLWSGRSDLGILSGRDIEHITKMQYMETILFSILGFLFISLILIFRKREKDRKNLEGVTSQLKTVLDTVLDGIVTTDEHGIILSFNRGAEKIFGYRAEEVIEENVKILMPEPDKSQHDTYIENYIKTGIKNIIGQGRESIGLLKNGKKISIELSVNEMRQGGKRYFVGSIHDITKQKEISNQLKAAKEKAEDAASTKTAMLANMSHEIRTPMNGIIGIVNLLLDKDLGEEERKFVNLIDKSVQSLLFVVNEILDFSKIEVSKISLESKPYDLSFVLSEQVKVLQPLAAEKGLKLTIKSDNNIPTFVMGDEGRVRHILINLIGNAIKFTEKGGSIQVVVGVVSREKEDPLVIKVSVRDSGIGIPKDQQEKIFEDFYQASSGTTREVTGAGLGLSITKKLVKMMGGEIGVKSEEGRGANFWFTLCLPKATEKQVEETVKERENIKPSFGPKHVLVAEDVATNQFVIKTLLDLIGCTYDIVGNGEKAIQMVKDNKYDLVLMDCHMPVMDGFDATRKIREDISKDLFIVALTANATEEDRDECLNAGMNDFLSKPLDKNDLVKCFNRLFKDIT